MRVFDGCAGMPKVKFGSVAVGDCFYYQDRLYTKGTARVEGQTLHASGGRMTDFGLDLEDGHARSFADEAEVIAAKAHVRVEEVGRFT